MSLASEAREVEYQVEMTPEVARATIAPLDRALWAQNERIYQRARDRMSWRPRLRAGGVLLSVGGVALSEWAWANSRRRAELYLGYAGLFAAFGLVFALAPSLERWMRAGTRRLVAWGARRTMEQVARRAPYTIRYRLADGVLSTEVEKLSLSLRLDLRTVPVAIADQRIVCVFRKPYTGRAGRVLYLPGSAERTVLIDALRSRGATVVEVAE